MKPLARFLAHSRPPFISECYRAQYVIIRVFSIMLGMRKVGVTQGGKVVSQVFAKAEASIGRQMACLACPGRSG